MIPSLAHHLTSEQCGQAVVYMGQVIRLVLHATQATDGQAGQKLLCRLAASQDQACREARVVLRAVRLKVS